MSEEKVISTQDLINEFYSKPYYMSYSGLNKLLFSPNLFFKHYILQQREEQTESYLIDGKVIHCLLLNDGSFEENFILLPSSLPSTNSRLVIDKVFSLTKDQPGLLSDHSTIVLDILKQINLHQALKTDEQRIAKIITEENVSYYSFLLAKGNKDIIDTETLQRCNEAVSVLHSNEQVCELLGLLRSEMDNVDVYNEHALQLEKGDFSFGLKGVLDNIKVDHAAKTIYINDLKTTSKTITDFKETVEFYNYWLQAAIYVRLVVDKFSELVLGNDYKIVFNFIVLDRYQQVYAFEVSEDSLKNWDTELTNKLNEAAWHYDNRNYSLPKMFVEGKVYL